MSAGSVRKSSSVSSGSWLGSSPRYLLGVGAKSPCEESRSASRCRATEPHVDRGYRNFEPVGNRVRVVVEAYRASRSLGRPERVLREQLGVEQTTRRVRVFQSASAVWSGRHRASPAVEFRSFERRSWRNPPQDCAPPAVTTPAGFESPRPTPTVSRAAGRLPG